MPRTPPGCEHTSGWNSVKILTRATKIPPFELRDGPLLLELYRNLAVELRSRICTPHSGRRSEASVRRAGSFRYCSDVIVACWNLSELYENIFLVTSRHSSSHRTSAFFGC